MTKDVVIMVPTETEAAGIRKLGEHISIRICGVGVVETAAQTARVLASRKPDMMILAGIAGAYAELRPGRSVIVRSETCADTGSFRGKDFTPLFSKTYDCPYASMTLPFPLVRSNTVNAACAPFVPHDTDIENMEGAAFFAICSGAGVPFLELRTISNKVGDPREKWEVDLAVGNLARDIKVLLDEIDR